LSEPEKERGFSAPLLERKDFEIKRESIISMFGSLCAGKTGEVSE
jgi:hypothetical protein